MLDLSHRQDLAWLAQLVADVKLAAPNLRPLVVGALARDIWLHYGHGIEIRRGTEDVDLALAVDWKGFSDTRDALIATGLFETLRNETHKLRHRKVGWIGATGASPRCCGCPDGLHDPNTAFATGGPDGRC